MDTTTQPDTDVDKAWVERKERIILADVSRTLRDVAGVLARMQERVGHLIDDRTEATPETYAPLTDEAIVLYAPLKDEAIVLQVAQAIRETEPECPGPWNLVTPFLQEIYLAQARAAIRTIMDASSPTDLLDRERCLADFPTDVDERREAGGKTWLCHKPRDHKGDCIHTLLRCSVCMSAVPEAQMIDDRCTSCWRPS